MPVRFFQDANTSRGIRGAANFLAGVSNVDPGGAVEQGVLLPWVLDAKKSWLEYRCWVECHLDPGTVLHKPLPQAAYPYDTLASADVANGLAAGMAGSTLDVNLKSNARFRDFVQQAATPTYRFVLKGHALRAGYKPPVPGLKTVAGVPAIPTDPQWTAGPEVVANFGQIPVYFCQWELWYLVELPPRQPQEAPPNMAAFTRGDARPPSGGIQVPYSTGDYNSVQAGPQGGATLTTVPGAGFQGITRAPGG